MTSKSKHIIGDMEMDSDITEIGQIYSLHDLKSLKKMDIVKTVQWWRNNVYFQATPVSIIGWY